MHLNAEKSKNALTMAYIRKTLVRIYTIIPNFSPLVQGLLDYVNLIVTVSGFTSYINKLKCLNLSDIHAHNAVQRT